ncbi:hypothetical protein CIPAW_05G249200 [Carya illinoinensis]|uniref:Uncharacterized protein n=1 Tax=Carya illinoinensis TaxID=32201 RepID=A0A8T1QNS7_CARIL|nr:hypothetical protein CIPAW_05G249200 [Carya illinoinensis]
MHLKIIKLRVCVCIYIYINKRVKLQDLRKTFSICKMLQYWYFIYTHHLPFFYPYSTYIWVSLQYIALYIYVNILTPMIFMLYIFYRRSPSLSELVMNAGGHTNDVDLIIIKTV